MKKLWKGLFHCVWHANKVPVQTNLINRLSSWLPKLDLSLSIQYLSVFLHPVCRKWNGIDVLRGALLESLPKLVNSFSSSTEWADNAAVAITTIDLVSKCVAIESQLFKEFQSYDESGTSYVVGAGFISGHSSQPEDNATTFMELYCQSLYEIR